MCRHGLVVIAASFMVSACGTSAGAPPSPTSEVLASSTTSLEATTVPESTMTTKPSGVLPVPEDVPLPPVSQLADVQVTLTPLLQIEHLLGMVWSELAQSFYLITQDGQVHRAPLDLSTSELVLDLTAEVSPFVYGSERGMLGIAINPVDGRLFLNFTDLDRDGYSVPTDNPFVNDPTKRPEIFAKGLRQPHRFTLNRANGEIWIGEVGENTMEELNRIPPRTSGQNFGWYFYEGFDRRSAGGSDIVFTEPIYQFPHPGWIAIIARYVHHGTKIPQLRGALIVGDMTGPIHAVGADGLQRLTISEKGNVLTSFAEGPDGELYTLSLDGGVKRIDPA